MMGVRNPTLPVIKMIVESAALIVVLPIVHVTLIFDEPLVCNDHGRCNIPRPVQYHYCEAHGLIELEWEGS